jgi:hypothetical protein
LVKTGGKKSSFKLKDLLLLVYNDKTFLKFISEAFPNTPDVLSGIQDIKVSSTNSYTHLKFYANVHKMWSSKIDHHQDVYICGSSNDVLKGNGDPETYAICYEPIENYVDLQVYFDSHTSFSEKNYYGYEKGFPSLTVLDVIKAALEEVTLFKNNLEKKASVDSLKKRIDDAIAGKVKFYTMDEVKDRLFKSVKRKKK